MLKTCPRVWLELHLYQLLFGHLKIIDSEQQPWSQYPSGMVIIMESCIHLTLMKLANQYLGPFKIIQEIDPIIVKLLLPSSIRVFLVFHV
ncbi:unnamed protein product [Caretta caretta]